MKERTSNLVPAVAIVGLGLLALGGCTATSPESASRAPAPVVATRSAALFATPGVEPPFGDEFEFSRRDAALALTIPQPTLASSDWPQPGIPSLDNPRAVYLYNWSYNEFLYFAPNNR